MISSGALLNSALKLAPRRPKVNLYNVFLQSQKLISIGNLHSAESILILHVLNHVFERVSNEILTKKMKLSNTNQLGLFNESILI